MHKKVWILGLAGVSVASVAAVSVGVRPGSMAALMPAAMQSAVLPLQQAMQQQPLPSPPPYAMPADLSGAVAQWNSLRQTDSLPFSSYASFLLIHPGWPGETGLRKTAEKAINIDALAPQDVIGFFTRFPPLSLTGQARYALALKAVGRGDEAREIARKTWIGGSLSPADESRLLTQFSATFTPEDHDRRIDALISGGDITGALRMMPLASAAKRPLFDTRLALRSNASDASLRLAQLGPSFEGDPGLLMDRANQLRNSGQALAARQLLAQRPPLTTRPANPEKWLETMLTIAREAGNDRQWTTAYDIASKVGDVYSPGVDVSDQPYGERDDYTSLAWLAGYTAVNRIGRPADAVRLFELYANAARSQQSRSKGFYWAARAALKAGDQARSEALLNQAATAPDQFYGQLALERLGRPIPAPAMPPPATPEQRAAFERQTLVRVARALGQAGQYGDQTLFVRAIAQQAEDDPQRQLAAEFGRQIGRPDLGVWVAREARAKGANFYSRDTFPEVTLSPIFSRYWTLAHAITRQESSFDRTAVSNAGARGMMQLMPGTARDTAGKLGMPYEFGRLTSDPSYNMLLGTSYFSTLLDQWGGNAALAVASYNAGTGNVRKWVALNGDPRTGSVDIVQWIEEIPFFETRNYVQRVLENAVVYDTLSRERTDGPSSYRLSYYLGKGSPG
ncbi:MAG: lytic transglycosylase protein [Alphaproteobacteria bacterium]|nr:lytic transglycosylase protein [Alphaproteobacteria bacterium]MDB5722558.1 lytic transglycosylase protein [Alphaproteobacteria bacterium]